MKLAIMQPYFLPYIGYFQLINSVDRFVIYDNIKYTKKGWINRNRFLQSGKDADFTIPLKKDSDYLDVRERVLASDFDKTKLLNKFANSYRKAPQFDTAFSIIKKIVLHENTNLFDYIYFSVKEICTALEIKTETIVSSDVKIDHALKGQDKVIAICKYMGADTYINAIGGQELYSKAAFNECNIDLKFIKSLPVNYAQFNNEFVPWLSIVDVLMFNQIELIKNLLNNYELI